MSKKKVKKVKNNKKLHPGAIVGIVIWVLVIIAILVVIVILYINYKNESKNNTILPLNVDKR
jgi:hypothetical protein